MDVDQIAETLKKHNGDVVKTIMELSNLSEQKRHIQERSARDQHMDTLREIMDDKERVFHEVLSNMKKETT